MADPLVHTEKTGPRPAMSDICSQCKDVFSVHYSTYDNSKTGCSKTNPEPGSMSRKVQCNCSGFQSIFRWEHDLNIVDVWQMEKSP